MFENVIILIATMVMDNLMTLVKWEQILPLFNQAIYFTNTVSWVFENVVILFATMVMDDLLTLVKWEQILLLFKKA